MRPVPPPWPAQGDKFTASAPGRRCSRFHPSRRIRRIVVPASSTCASSAERARRCTAALPALKVSMSSPLSQLQLLTSRSSPQLSSTPLPKSTWFTRCVCASSSCTTSPRCTSHTTTRPVSDPSASRPGGAALLLPPPTGRGTCHATLVHREARCVGRASCRRSVEVTVSHRLTRPSLETVASSSGRPLCWEKAQSMPAYSPVGGGTAGHVKRILSEGGIFLSFKLAVQDPSEYYTPTLGEQPEGRRLFTLSSARRRPRKVDVRPTLLHWCREDSNRGGSVVPSPASRRPLLISLGKNRLLF